MVTDVDALNKTKQVLVKMAMISEVTLHALSAEDFPLSALRDHVGFQTSFAESLCERCQKKQHKSAVCPWFKQNCQVPYHNILNAYMDGNKKTFSDLCLTLAVVCDQKIFELQSL